MSEGAYFRDADDYHDWWSYSGTALGASSPGETFRMLDEQLSQAGANAVIAARFLDENDRGIDPQLWRRAFVFGHVGLQVSLTLRALEAIGAVGVVRALRSSPVERSPLSLAQEMVRSGNLAPGEAAEAIKGVRESLAVGLAHILGDVPDGLPSAIPQPRPAEGVETREDIRRLLDAYVSAHRDDLARDVARYGDPRKHPDFDPEAAREDRARRIKRLNHLSYQRNAIDGLREQMGKLNSLAQKEPPESPRLNKVLRKVLDEYRSLADNSPEDLTREVQGWLREVERFRDAHPEVLRPKASRDERVNARLAAIGPYEVSYDRDTPSIWWDDPAGMACDWAALRLGFHLVLEKRPAPSRVAATLDALCDECGRLQTRWPDLRTGLERHVVDFFRRVAAGHLPADDRAAFEGDDGEFSAGKILAAVEGGTIVLTRHFEQPVHTVIHFDASWDEEHGVEVQLDEDGEILSWF
ncbi:hypothetical protein OJF2_40780 [Aquisphaera giovannonii]|uniref:Uncharacterized protein n=1 Tax=Aquisphaera giovannonii TaxID=406548 RepID=A0A5B9W4G9_9BACT|nr:hypothetical protein [Aquisphaera giovannonii]QEH35526.1 hypothetical protein OJF2_40780 [Aquisphaera giovannonii]